MPITWRISVVLRSLMEHASAVLFPPRCGSCGQLLCPGQTWCSSCWTEFAQATGREYCPTCATNLGPHQTIDRKRRCHRCKNAAVPLGGICRLGTYETALSRAIVNFKFHNYQCLGNYLADMLADVIREQPWFDEVDALCPVPIHWTRRIERGFNQSQVLADQIFARTQKPAICLLKRVRPTPHQVGLAAAARADNIRDAFEARKRWPVTGSTVCLIDDVMTTGSTLFEAARTLKKAGAARVYAAVLAKADDSAWTSV